MPSEILLRGPHLVVLIGGAGAGKSTWADAHFLPTEIVSTDRCRALVGDREDVQAFSAQAFELFYFLVEKRMELGKLVVADSTALDARVRRRLLDLAERHGYPALAVAFTAGIEVRRERNRRRGRRVDDDVLVRHQDQLGVALAALSRERWERVSRLSPEEADATAVRTLPAGISSPTPPPYDVIGDVHGCLPELRELLDALGWERDGDAYRHPEGRVLVSVGDLADRGPNVPGCFRLWLELIERGRGLYVPGNHDFRLMRALRGREVRAAYGLRQSLEQLAALPPEEGDRLRARIARLVADSPPYLTLDGGRVVVAHAGIKQAMIGKLSRRIERFTRYGDVTGERTPDGLPVRRDWAAEYRGGALVLYGHTPVRRPVLRNRTANLDTGCAFGGRLTALRYPEMEFRSVRAHETYAARPGGLDGMG